MNRYTDEHIAVYLHGRLNEADAKAFEQAMREDENLLKTVNAHKMMMEGIKEGVRHRLKKRLRQKEADLKALKAKSETSYTLQDLLDMFEPVPHYEHLLKAKNEQALVSRAGGCINLLSPQRNEAVNESLLFEFSAPSKEALTLLIENNNETEVFEEKLPQNASEYVVSVIHFAPGRYYWKLIGEDSDMLMGCFLVRKHLLPS